MTVECSYYLTMSSVKKFLSKIDASSQQNPLIGKVFVIGKFTVTVEDVIAQGKTDYFINIQVVCKVEK